MFKSPLSFIALFIALLFATANIQAAELNELSIPSNGEAAAELEEVEEIKKEDTKLEKPSGKNLKQKKLSEAFERFIPSEKISADNAVPFPVDI